MKRVLCWVWRLTHARSQVGTRVGGIKPFYRGSKVTVIGAISLKKVLAVMTMNGKDSGLRLGNQRRHEKVTRMGKYSITEKSHCAFTLKPTSLNHR